MAFCSEPRKVCSNLSDLRERPQLDVFRQTLQNYPNQQNSGTHDRQPTALLRSLSRKGRQSFKTDDCAKKKLRLELGTEAREAHKALQNITTSKNALRSPNMGKETSAGSHHKGLKLILGTNLTFNQLSAEIL